MAKMSRTQVLDLTGRRPVRRAVYAGSFDPPTTGHMYMIREGAKLFDELIVAVGDNPEKRYTFTLDERENLMRECVKGIPNVRTTHFSGTFLVEFAHSVGAGYVLRGIRNVPDYEYERSMRNINGDIRASIVTVFLFPPREFCEISSSFIKGLVGPKGWEKIVEPYLPEPVYKRFLESAAKGKMLSTGEPGGLKDMTERA